MQQRRKILAGLLGFAGLGKLTAKAETAGSEARGGSGPSLLFAQHDRVIEFSPVTGLGTQVGIVTGRIVGISQVNFQFVPLNQTDIKFDNRVIISDLDGDQLIFRNVGTGRFLAPPLSDPGSPLGALFGLGGPLVGTYECLFASGKYQYLVKRVFPYRSIAGNPAKAGLTGTVYVEVYNDRFDEHPI